MLLSLLLLRAVDRKFHASVCMCTLSRLYPLATRAEFSVSNSPTGMYCGGSDTKADKNPTPFAKYLASFVHVMNSGLRPLNTGAVLYL